MIRHFDLPEGYRLTRSDPLILISRAGRERVLKAIAQGRADLRKAPGIAGRADALRLKSDGSRPSFLVKQYWRGGIFRGVMRQRLLGIRRFISELLLTEIAAAAGLNTARIAGLLLKRVDGIFWTATLVSEEIENAPDLARLAAGEYPDMPRAARNAVLKAVAGEIRKMHDAGIFHADLHLKNILIQGNNDPPQAFIIDFDRGDYFKQLSLRNRLNNLMRLDRSAEKFNRKSRVISATDRLRMLKYYAGHDGEMYRQLRRGVRAFAFRRKTHRLWWRLISVFRKD